MKDLEALQKKWKHFGAWDTASEEAVAMYIAKEKLRLIRIA